MSVNKDLRRILSEIEEYDLLKPDRDNWLEEQVSAMFEMYDWTMRPPNECPIKTGGDLTSFWIKSAMSLVCV